VELKDAMFLIVLVGVLVGGYAWHRRRLFAVGRNWKKLARRFGGKLEHDGEGWIKQPNYVMTCEVSGVALTLGYVVTSTGRSTSYSTRVTTPCDADLEFQIYQEGVFQKIAKTVGLQDVDVGDAEYDRTFLIKAKDPNLFRKLCARPFRERHLANPNLRVWAEAGTLGIVCRDLVSEFDESLRLLEFAALAAETFASA